jgi:hypothetical protein
MAKIGSATAAITLIERSRDRGGRDRLAHDRGIVDDDHVDAITHGGHLGTQLAVAHPDVAAPDVEDHVAVPMAAEVLGGEPEAALRDRGAPELDVRLGDRGPPLEVIARWNMRPPPKSFTWNSPRERPCAGSRPGTSSSRPRHSGPSSGSASHPFLRGRHGSM